MSNLFCKTMENLENNPSLIAAAQDGNVEIIRELLLMGRDPNTPDKRGRRPLHLAAMRGKETITEIMLEAGADVGAQDHQGNTPLHYCGHVETIHCLLQHGADPNARNNHGDTPLMLMRRRDVEPDAIALLETQEEEEEETVATSDSSQPLLKRHRLQTLRDKSLQHVKGMWTEFFEDLGLERLLAMLLVILCLSLYVAYVLTGIAMEKAKIPVDAEMKRMEL